jgi:hypothetical protein
MNADETAAFKAAVGDDTYNLFFGDTLRKGATAKTRKALGVEVKAPDWMKNLWTGRGVTQAGRAADQRAIPDLLEAEAQALASTRGGANAAVSVHDRIQAAKTIERAVKDGRARPTELLDQYTSTGRSLSTNAVSPASSQGRAALAGQQAADEAAAAAKAKGQGGTLMDWARANPMPAAVVGGAGLLALPKLVNGGGGSTIVT